MISIIVSVYNIEKYVEACVGSILNSTYSEFEIILVDDGSTDSSSEICDRLSQQDNRIRVLHKRNGGVSDARNAGVNSATGEQIMFVDGDDMIHPQMIELLKMAYDSGDYDFSMVMGKRIAEGDVDGIKSFVNHRVGEPRRRELSQLDFMEDLVSDGEKRMWCLSVCNKLYASGLVKDALFDTSIKNSEDLEWTARLSLKIKRVVAVYEQMYLYIHRQGSAMHGGLNSAYINGIYVYKKVVDYLPDQFKSRALKQLYTYMLLIRRYSIHSPFSQEANAICDEIYNGTIQDFMSSDINWISKMRSVLGYHFPGLYNSVTRFLEVIMVKYYRLRGRNW